MFLFATTAGQCAVYFAKLRCACTHCRNSALEQPQQSPHGSRVTYTVSPDREELLRQKETLEAHLTHVYAQLDSSNPMTHWQSGCILVYLKKEYSHAAAMGVLQTLESQAPDGCSKPHVQIEDKLYWLEDDGALRVDTCQSQLQILAAQVEVETTSSEATADPAATNTRTLYVKVAALALGDKLRLDLEAQLQTVTLDLPNDPHPSGPVTVSVKLPRHAKSVRAVEQLRGGFASYKVNLPAETRYHLVHHVALFCDLTVNACNPWYCLLCC